MATQSTEQASRGLWQFVDLCLESYAKTATLAQEQAEQVIKVLLEQGDLNHKQIQDLLQQWLKQSKELKLSDRYVKTMQETLDKIKDILRVSNATGERGESNRASGTHSAGGAGSGGCA